MMKEFLTKIKWWEALLLFHVLLFLSHFIYNSQIKISDETFEFDISNFLIYNQLVQTFYHWLKFIIVGVILFAGAYLMNRKFRYVELLKCIILAELLYFIPRLLLFIDYYALKTKYKEAPSVSSFEGKLSAIFNLEEGSLFYAFAKNISIVDFLYFGTLFLIMHSVSELSKNDTSRVLLFSYFPAFFVYISINVLATFL